MKIPCKRVGTLVIALLLFAAPPHTARAQGGTQDQIAFVRQAIRAAFGWDAQASGVLVSYDTPRSASGESRSVTVQIEYDAQRAQDDFQNNSGLAKCSKPSGDSSLPFVVAQVIPGVVRCGYNAVSDTVGGKFGWHATGDAAAIFPCGNLLVVVSRDMVQPTLIEAPLGNDPQVQAAESQIIDESVTQVKQMAQALANALNANGDCTGAATIQLQIRNFTVTSPDRGAGTAIRFEEGAQVNFAAGVSANNPKDKIAIRGLGGVTYKILYDGNQVSSGQTKADGIPINASGAPDVRFSLPADTPQGRSQHQVQVQVSKENYQPAEETVQIEVWRGLANTKMLIQPLGGVYDVNQSVTIQGKVFVDGPKPWGTAPVAATVSVSDANGKLLGTAVTQAGGTFSLGVQLGKATIGGIFNILDIHAVPSDASHYADAETELQIKMKPGKTLLVTLSTDQGVYADGETVTAQGTATSDGNPVSVDVQLFADGVSQGTQTTDSSGSFSLSFVPTNAPNQIIIPGAQHFVVASAKATGYNDGAATAYFLVGGEGLDCVPLPFDVLTVKGQPTASSLIPPGAIPALSSGAPKSGQAISVPPASPIAAGNKLTQAMSVHTGANDQVVLSLPLEGGGEVRIGVDAGTELKIGSFCRDASGKVKLLLKVDNPGKILINIDNPQGGASPLAYKIVTPRTNVTSVSTRYAVAVDEQGATTVASFDGVVLVSDLQDANTAQVEAAKQLTIPIGSTPNQLQPTARTLSVDPNLEQLMNPASTAASAPIPTGFPRDATAAAQAHNAAPSGNKSEPILTYVPTLVLVVFGVVLLLIIGALIIRISRASPRTATDARAPNLPAQNRPTDLPEMNALSSHLPEGGASRFSKPTDLPK